MGTDTTILAVKSSGTEATSADLRRLSSDLKTMGAAGANAAGLLAAGLLAAGGAVGGLINEVTSSIDEMNTFANATGLSIDVVKGLSLEAKRTGKDLQDLIPKDLAKRMREAQRGGKVAAEAFEDLGISVADLDLMSVDDTFKAVIDSLSKMENGQDRAAIAAELLGKQGRQMLSAFEDGAASLDQMTEAGRRWGIDVGPEAIEATAQWQAATQKLAIVVDELKASIIPLIGPIADGVSDFATGATFVFTALSEQIKTVAIRMNRLANFEFGSLIGDIAENGFGLQNSLDAATEAAYDLNQALGELPKNEGTELLTSDDGLSRGLRDVDTSARGAASSVDELAAALARKAAAEQKARAATAEHFRGIDDGFAAVQERLEGEFWQSMDAGFAEVQDSLDESMDAAVTHAQQMRDAQIGLVQGVADFTGTISGLVGEQLDTTKKKGREAAVALFAVEKGAALSSIAINTAVAIMRTLADLGPIAGPIASVGIGLTGAAQAAVVAAQKPTFHRGSRAADEYPAMLRTRERVITPQGSEAIANANAGAALSMGGSYELVVGHEALNKVLLRQIRDRRSSLARAQRKQRTTPLGRRS